MPIETKFYDLDAVSLSIAGYPITGGFGEGGAISIKYDTERFEVVEGVGGDVVRSKTNSRLATVEVTLLQTAAGNATLEALARLDDNGVNGAGVGAFRCEERNGGDLYAGSKCWVQKRPDVELSRKATDRTWVLKVADLEPFPGGRPGV